MSYWSRHEEMKNSVKVERAKLDMSQSDLAEKVGVAPLTIHNIEKSKKSPSVLLALKIAKVFKTSVESIFSLENSDYETNR